MEPIAAQMNSKPLMISCSCSLMIIGTIMSAPEAYTKVVVTLVCVILTIIHKKYHNSRLKRTSKTSRVEEDVDDEKDCRCCFKSARMSSAGLEVVL